VTAYDDSLSLATIYAAEQNVAIAVQTGGAADFFGSTLDLGRCTIRTYRPDQLPLLQGMVGALYERHNGTRRQKLPQLRVSAKAYRRAWYDTGDHAIVLPMARWAWNDMTLMHELAHACNGYAHDQRQAHGLAWRRLYAALVADVVGAEAALLLQAALDL